VTGAWNGERIIGEKLEYRDPEKDINRGQVSGRIDEINLDKQWLQVGPVRVVWNKGTRFKQLSLASLKPGDNVKASGRILSPGVMGAERISLGSSSVKANQVQLIGATEDGALTEDKKALLLKVMGVLVEIPRDLDVKVSRLTTRPDDHRPDEQFTAPLFGRPLTIGGEYEISPIYRKDFALDDAEDDDLFRLDQEIQLEMFYSLHPRVFMFVEAKLFWEKELFKEGGGAESEAGLDRGETWLYLDRMWGSPFALQVGRQNFNDDREWWWDEDLDAVRLHYDSFRFHGEVAVAQELGNDSTRFHKPDDEFDIFDPEKKDVFRLISHAIWQYQPRQIAEGFLLGQFDHSSTESPGQLVETLREDSVDGDLWWAGARLRGKLKDLPGGRVDYWGDLALVWGEEDLIDFNELGGGVSQAVDRQRNDVFGWGLDIGASWTLPARFSPTVTFGYAFGSGDSDLGDGDDGNFRQTGLNDNNDRFRGVDRFRYYGELLRPELSNLHIFTLSLGVPFMTNSSVELVFHDYRQVTATDFLRDSRLDADPLGEDTHIGNELDLVIGLEEWEHWELEWVGAVFRSGDAFGPLSGEYAFNTFFKVNYNF